MLASRARHVARDLVTRAIAAPMAALASAPALDSVAATARDRARGGAFGADELRDASWAPRVSARDGSERAGSVPPSARARFADTRAPPSAPRWPRRRAPFQPWRVDPAPPRSLTVRELQACLRASASARAGFPGVRRRLFRRGRGRVAGRAGRGDPCDRAGGRDGDRSVLGSKFKVAGRRRRGGVFPPRRRRAAAARRGPGVLPGVREPRKRGVRGSLGQAQAREEDEQAQAQEAPEAGQEQDQVKTDEPSASASASCKTLE